MGGVPLERPLRVLQVVHVYHPVVAGSEALFRRLAEGLRARNVHVSVFTSTARSANELMDVGQRLTAGDETRNGVPVRRFRHRQLPATLLRGLGGVSHLWTIRRWPGYGFLKAVRIGPILPGLVRSAVALDPDVIAATAAPCLPIFRAAAAARRLGCPFAVMPCLHSDHAWFMDNPSLLRLLGDADAVMTLTSYEQQLLRALDVPADRLWLIGGGVAADAAKDARVGLRATFGLAPGVPIVLFLGRKEEAKGVGDVLEAMRRLWLTGRTATLVLAGPSTAYSRSTLSARIASLPHEWKDRVLVRDEVTEEEKWGWYAECDLFAHPSHAESFGLVFLEAWLCGKPVVGGRTGPQSCLIDEGEDGLLVRPGDVEELARAIDRILFEPGLGARLGRAGQDKTLRHHTWDSVVDRAEAMYRSLASGRHAAG